ncbi:MAG: MOSC domain-containing protein [Actinomycetia bacterium]|nr:MOSC domain-containing protein [Actinomycetes bacterium]MCP4086180.1 MOSC domain-containing protein [Actinomycetes bacterium]
MQLASIHIHPIKSCHRLEVETARVSVRGIEHDREWQVTTPEGEPITQRQHPVMATVQPTLISGGLRLEAPGRQPIEVPHPTDASATVRTLFKVPVEVGDAGDDVAAWFCDLFGEPARLTAFVGATQWRLPGGFDVFDQDVSFADAAPVLVANTASLAWLNERASEPFGMDRFRPNLVVDTDEAWVEDTWSRFRVGAASVTTGSPWPRCPIPQIDQDTAERHKEPALALKAHRWCTDASAAPARWRGALEGSGLFGIGCAIGPTGTDLTVGDPVEVDETTAPLAKFG